MTGNLAEDRQEEGGKEGGLGDSAMVYVSIYPKDSCAKHVTFYVY